MVMSAAELRAHPHRFTTDNAYGIRVGRSSLVAVYGKQGSGKSTMCAKFLDSIPGDVLYCPVEEGIRSDTVADRLEWLEIHRDGFYVADLGLIRDLDPMMDRDYRAIGIDSLNRTKLLVPDLRALSDQKGLLVMFVLQITKEGLAAGPQSTLHDADVVIRVEGMRWEIEKSRYEAPRQGEVMT